LHQIAVIGSAVFELPLRVELEVMHAPGWPSPDGARDLKHVDQ
jgi:hypothetical protein